MVVVNLDPAVLRDDVMLAFKENIGMEVTGFVIAYVVHLYVTGLVEFDLL